MQQLLASPPAAMQRLCGRAKVAWVAGTVKAKRLRLSEKPADSSRGRQGSRRRRPAPRSSLCSLLQATQGRAGPCASRGIRRARARRASVLQDPHSLRRRFSCFLQTALRDTGRSERQAKYSTKKHAHSAAERWSDLQWHCSPLPSSGPSPPDRSMWRWKMKCPRKMPLCKENVAFQDRAARLEGGKWREG